MQKFLTYIKQEIKRKIKLDANKEKITDNKIIPLLEKETDFISDKKKCYYIELYTAFYFDNIHLLKFLKENDISLGIYPSNLSIYLLDNSFTKYFTNTSYLNFITRYKPYLHSFFLSIKDLEPLKKEEYIRTFILLTISLNKTLKILESNPNSLTNSLFTKKTLDTFSIDTYKAANTLQLNNIIAALENAPKKGTVKRLNNLIRTTNFSLFFHNYDLMFELFSDEELLNMTTSPEYFFTKALNNGFDLQRVLYIYKHYPEIINNSRILSHEIFNNYSDNEIIFLSKNINFNNSKSNKELKFYHYKRRVLALLPWTK